jgi:threonine aldolase
MRYSAAQFVTALEHDLWISTASHANSMAHLLWERLRDIESLRLVEPAANSLYPVLSPAARRELQAWSFFWDWDLSQDQVRWMTSWDTTVEDVEAFAEGVRETLSR